MFLIEFSCSFSSCILFTIPVSFHLLALCIKIKGLYRSFGFERRARNRDSRLLSISLGMFLSWFAAPGSREFGDRWG